MLKKFWTWVTSLINPDKIEDLVIDKLGDFGAASWEKMYAAKPKAAIAMIQSLYCWLPFAAEAAAKTSTDVDDKGVAEVKKEIEELASKHGISLIDLDAE